MPAEDHDDILNKIKAWALPGLGALLLFLLNLQVNSAVGEMKDTRQQMQQMITDAKVSATRYDYLVERVKNLEDSKKEAGQVHQQLDARISSLEQRAALYDQFLQSRK